jgi:hypothetical protein
MKRITGLPVLLALFAGCAFAQSDEMGSTICCEFEACYLPATDDPVARLNASDDELNRTYSAVLAKYQDDAKAIAAIRTAQRTWIKLRDQDFEATRLSWKGIADIDTPGIENSVLFAGIRMQSNLARAAYLCTNYLEPRG